MKASTTSEGRQLIVGLGGTTGHNSSSQKALQVALKAAEAAGAEIMLFTGPQLMFPIYEPNTMTRTKDATRFLETLQ